MGTSDYDVVERLRWQQRYTRGVVTVTQEDAALEIERLRTALTSIANNTCCDRCQEAAKVARAALEPSPHSGGKSTLGGQ